MIPPDRTSLITWRDPYGSEPTPWKPDFLLPSLFLCVAALLIATIDPIYVELRPYQSATLLMVAVGCVVVGLGAFKSDLRLLVAGSAFLLVILALCVGTQPVRLAAALSAIWPLRLGLFALVVFAWAILMSPPVWLRRAVMALAIPCTLALLAVGGPTLTLQAWGWGTPATPKFPPNWLAVDSRGTIYATNVAGNYLWVFSPSGVPIGTLWPGAAPAVGTPGPGIVTLADPAPSTRARSSSLRLMEPLTTTVSADQLFTFNLCGVAVDALDRLYIADNFKLKLLQFDARGFITGRWALPTGFGGSTGCIAADDKQVYLASRSRTIHFFDFQGNETRRVSVDYDPVGIADDNAGSLYILGAGKLEKIDVSTGKKQALILPPAEGQLFAAYQSLVVRPDGEIIVSDRANARMLRIAPGGGKITASIGERGSWQGQFLAPGGLALDRENRIYVADWAIGVIQRFSLSGRFESAWYAPGEKIVPSLAEEGE